MCSRVPPVQVGRRERRRGEDERRRSGGMDVDIDVDADVSWLCVVCDDEIDAIRYEVHNSWDVDVC